MVMEKKRLVDALKTAETELEAHFIAFLEKQAKAEHDLRDRKFNDPHLEATWLCFVEGAAFGVRQCTRFLIEVTAQQTAEKDKDSQ